MKQAVNNLKDYAELAQASYFYFDFLKDSNNIPRKIYELNKQGQKIKDENSPRGYKEIEINLEHIISKEYQGQEVLINLKQDNTWQSNLLNSFDEKTNSDKLNGKFSEIQAEEFVKRYKIYFHQPNTLSGFSATLFYDTQEDRFVVGFRGTEGVMDIIQDLALSLNANPQSSALLDFLIEVSRFVKIYNKRTIFVGHSLGGYLAQWALIYCDSLHKDKLKFSPSEVYTFNAPSIDGWNFPSPIINPNTIKILQEIFDKRSIDISNKITHIYDSGGIKLIASAQYGSSNRLPIYTGNDSHSIIPLTQTLYLYSYLLGLKSNYDKVKDKNLKECIEYLNDFMQGVYKVFNPLSIAINVANNKKQADEANTATLSLDYLPQVKTQDTDFLTNFIEHILYVTSLEKEMENFYIQLHTTQENVIDKIIVLRDKRYYPKILDKTEIDNLDPKQCSIAEKRAIFKCQPFIIVNEYGDDVLNKDNIAKLFRYNSNSTKIALYSDESNTSYFNARLSMMKSILYENEMRVYHMRKVN